MGLKEKLSKRLESDIQINETSNTIEEANVIPFNKSAEPQILPDFQISLSQAKERLAMLQKFIKEMMKEGVDYGQIAGCPKPSLLKPGAEKLAHIFGFSKKVDVTNRIEDWEKGLFHYEVKVTLTNKRSGILEAEGVGSCNSKEKKYKNQDSFTLVNTFLKMAKKRAIVDAVLSATRSSDLFTQDVEDWADATPQALPTSSPNPKTSQSRNLSEVNPAAPVRQEINTSLTAHVPPATPAKPVSSRQLNLIFKLVEAKGLSAKEAQQIMFNRYNVTKSQELTSLQASDFIRLMQE